MVHLVLAEIVELTELLQPAPEEVQARRDAVDEIAGIVKGIWPSASVTVFGSFATGGRSANRQLCTASVWLSKETHAAAGAHATAIETDANVGTASS